MNPSLAAFCMRTAAQALRRAVGDLQVAMVCGYAVEKDARELRREAERLEARARRLEKKHGLERRPRKRRS